MHCQVLSLYFVEQKQKWIRQRQIDETLPYEPPQKEAKWHQLKNMSLKFVGPFAPKICKRFSLPDAAVSNSLSAFKNFKSLKLKGINASY